MVWPRNFSDHYQLALRIADVGVSAFVCEYDVYKIIVLCVFFFSRQQHGILPNSVRVNVLTGLRRR